MSDEGDGAAGDGGRNGDAVAPPAPADSPNRNTLWGRVVVDELVRAGVESVCLAPGSRCTPLTVAFSEHPDVTAFSHLDERSAAFFALGRAKRTGRPTPLVCTSGTAAANFHPAVIEAHQSRVPMLVLTADRPPELRDSGANQTVDQEKLYGDAVRAYRTLPEPEVRDRTVRSLRTAVSRAVGTATGVPAGPVHLNCPYRKPLEPTPVEGDVPDDFAERAPLAARGRDGGAPYVRTTRGRTEPGSADVDRLARLVDGADRGLLVCGPADRPAPDRDALADLARATGFPVLADPLSGLRFGPHVERDSVTVCGGYDSFLGGADDWPDPELVLRFGASPTSKPLRHHLRDHADRQVIVDPAGGWREAEFTATDLVVADETRFARALADAVSDPADPACRERFAAAEAAHWEVVEGADAFWEGRVLSDVAADAPDPATLFVSNSMPVRDLDRFGRPRAADITVLGNRGASGIDGITSSALGAGSATDDPLVLVTGDLAYYHDMNGLLAVGRCDVDATVVVVNNDGGGIFHLLPIEGFDPPFTDHFVTPHGLDFEPTADLYGLEFARAEDRSTFRDLFAESVGSDGTQVIEVPFDGEASHRTREALEAEVRERVADRTVD